MNLRTNKLLAAMLCIALLFVGCAKESTLADQAAEKLVIECTLEVGEPIEGVYVHGLRGIVADEAQSDLHIEIIDEVNTVLLSPIIDKPGFYQGPETYLISPESSYSLNVVFGEELISAETSTPPTMGVLSSSKDHIDAEIQGDLVFLEWTGVNTGSFNEYFYVIELIPLDDDAEAIMRFSENEKANNVLAYTSEATLSINDFNFFGPHSIKVYAISKDFEALFAPQSNVNQNGPSNIMNGYGYFIGASVIEGSLEIR